MQATLGLIVMLFSSLSFAASISHPPHGTVSIRLAQFALDFQTALSVTGGLLGDHPENTHVNPNADPKLGALLNRLKAHTNSALMPGWLPAQDSAGTLSIPQHQAYHLIGQIAEHIEGLTPEQIERLTDTQLSELAQRNWVAAEKPQAPATPIEPPVKEEIPAVIDRSRRLTASLQGKKRYRTALTILTTIKQISLNEPGERARQRFDQAVYTANFIMALKDVVAPAELITAALAQAIADGFDLPSDQVPRLTRMFSLDPRTVEILSLALRETKHASGEFYKTVAKDASASMLIGANYLIPPGLPTDHGEIIPMYIIPMIKRAADYFPEQGSAYDMIIDALERQSKLSRNRIDDRSTVIMIRPGQRP